MKTITLSPKQKKWALTASLLAVLGFNLSAPLHQGMQTLELASEDGPEVRTQTLISNNGKSEVQVEYRREGDKTLAVIRGNLEGGACESNGCLSAQVLNVPFESTALELERALRAQMVQIGDRPTPPRDEDLDPEEIAEARSQEIMERISKKCDRKDDGAEKAKCLTNEFIKALKKKSNKIEKSLALEFFRDEIRPHLLTAMTSEDLQSVVYGTALLGGQELSLEGSDLIRKLQAELPKEYSNVRKAAKDVAVEVVNYYSAKTKETSARAKDAQAKAQDFGKMADQTMALANQTADPAEKMRLTQQANQYRQLQMTHTQQAAQLNQESMTNISHLERFLVNGLRETQAAGLTEAYRAKLVEESYASKLLTDFQAQSAKALTNPSLPDITINPNQGGTPTAPSVPGKGQQIGIGNGMGTITGGSLGNTFKVQQPVNNDFNSFTGAPLTPPAGSPFIQRQYDPSLIRQ